MNSPSKEVHRKEKDWTNLHVAMTREAAAGNCTVLDRLALIDLNVDSPRFQTRRVKRPHGNEIHVAEANYSLVVAAQHSSDTEQVCCEIAQTDYAVLVQKRDRRQSNFLPCADSLFHAT